MRLACIDAMCAHVTRTCTFRYTALRRPNNRYDIMGWDKSEH